MRLLRLLYAHTTPLLDTLFPPTCWADPRQPHATAGLSDTARHQIAQLAEQRYCLACGLTTGPHSLNDPRFRCARCDQRDAGVVRIARVGTFSEPLISLIHQLKFARAWEIARVLSPFLYHAMLRVSEETQTPIDIMLPVPLHWTRRARRGFNQSHELAREVSRLSGWPLSTALRRRRRTSEQAKLHAAAARLNNLRNAFACRPDSRLAGRHLWLIDDVSTTGATLHAAATALRKLPKQSRPASINAAVLCITDHASPPPTTEISGNFD